ncbi:MAG TPA: YncE family protein [Micropepsaceae bacterium]
MKQIPVISLILSIAFSTSAIAAAAPNYKIVDRIKVQDGGFDYATFDAKNGRILMARPDMTTVIDVKTGKVSELKSAVKGHIALPIPGSALLAVTQRGGDVLLVDGAADKVVATFKGGKNPDGATYDPSSKMIFAMDHEAGNAIVIDPATKKLVTRIPVGGELEFAVPDGAGKVYVNVEDKNQIAVIDVAGKKVTARYALKGCDGPTGLAYDAADKLLISSCDGVAKVVRADTGAEVASLPTAKGADAVIFDAARKLAFIPCRAGTLEVLSFADPAHISIVQHVPTQVGTRTGTLDPATGRIYSMAAKFDPPAVAGGRPQALQASYEVLVIAPQ